MLRAWSTGGALKAVQAPLTPRPRGTIYEALPFFQWRDQEGVPRQGRGQEEDVTMPVECVTYGKTVEEAIEMARDAITGYVESLIGDGEAVPMEDDLIECRVTVEAHA